MCLALGATFFQTRVVCGNRLELMVKSGYDVWIQHPQITEGQLTHFRPYVKKLFFDLCNRPQVFKPRALGINSDGGIKREYVESCS